MREETMGVVRGVKGCGMGKEVGKQILERDMLTKGVGTIKEGNVVTFQTLNF